MRLPQPLGIPERSPDWGIDGVECRDCGAHHDPSELSPMLVCQCGAANFKVSVSLNRPVPDTYAERLRIRGEIARYVESVTNFPETGH